MKMDIKFRHPSEKVVIWLPSPNAVAILRRDLQTGRHFEFHLTKHKHNWNSFFQLLDNPEVPENGDDILIANG